MDKGLRHIGEVAKASVHAARGGIPCAEIINPEICPRKVEQGYHVQMSWPDALDLVAKNLAGSRL